MKELIKMVKDIDDLTKFIRMEEYSKLNLKSANRKVYKQYLHLELDCSFLVIMMEKKDSKENISGKIASMTNFSAKSFTRMIF